jgi:CRP-like cAMP-binding protein
MAKPVPDSVLEMARRVPALAAYAPDELRQLVRRGTTISVPAGFTLTREGRRGHELFVILEGRARSRADGTAQVTLGPGEVFGETAAIGGRPGSATVVALDPMSVLVLDVGALGSAVTPASL